MNNRNSFFKKLYSSPTLLWKAGAGLSFLVLAIVIAVVPSFIDLDAKTRYLFAGILLIYGLFRLGTFYAEYNSTKND